MEDLNDKVTTGTLSASEWNQVPSELQNVIEKSGGMTLTNASFDQLGQAITVLAAAADFYNETSGSDTNYNCDLLSSRHGIPLPLDATHEGLLVRFRPGTTNVGAATVNVNGAGSKTILRENGVALSAGDLVTTRDALLRYDFNAGTDRFFLLEAGLSNEAEPVPGRGHIDGFNTARDGTFPDERITINPGVARDSTDAKTLRHTVAMTKRIDANWAEGDNNGGFPSTLTLAADTWYHLFAIFRDSDGLVDFGFDTSITAANLLGGADAGTLYTEFRRIGAVRTDVGVDIIDYIQEGDQFLWTTSKQDVANSDPGTAEVTSTLAHVPVNVRTWADIGIGFASTATSDYFSVYGGGDATLPVPSASNNDGRAFGDDRGPFVHDKVLTNLSAQIKTRQSLSSGSYTLYVQTHGWVDPRGRNA